MIVCIISRKFGILAIFIISLLLCIRITTTDSGDENSDNSRTESTDNINQTATIDEHTPTSDENILSNSNSDTIPTESLPIVENDVPTISTENKSETIDEVFPSTAAPLVVDNQTSDEHQQTTTPSTKKNLSNINSFEEWKQQQLHADLLRKGEIDSQHSGSSETPLTSLSKGISSSTNIQQNPPTTGSSKKGKLRKNFASASCGAKMLAHNVEAQNVPSILSSSPDEYMLNPCNAKIWFAIELCESIRILNIEIANFELFSSVPKTFRVSASDRYPTKDWHRHHLGTFNASFNRTIQSFQTLESTTYLKYVKFELLDFHGHEHYCPLSVVRIHGSNVEDEIMTMEENTNLNDLKSVSDIQDENDNDDDDDNNNLSNDQQVGGIIGSAILDLAKRVFRRQTIRGTLSTTSIPIAETNVLKTNCHQSVINGSNTNNSINAWRHSDTFKLCIAEFLYGLWSKFDTCTMYLSQICFKLNSCCQCPLIINNNNRNDRMISTLNLYSHPCGYYHILTNQFVCKKEKLIELNKTITTNLNSELTQDFIEKNVTIDKNDTVMIVNESANSSSNQSMLNHNHTLLNESQTQFITNRSNEQSSSNNIPDETTIALESQIPSNTTNESSFQASTIDSVNIDLDVTEPSIDTNTLDEIVTLASTTTTTTTLSSTLINNEVMHPLISSPWLKGMLINTKSLPELFKIIEKLNFNLTLSNRYLQELSQHYVKKLDETQQTTDLLLKASKTADEKLENLEQHLYKLQENFNEMSCRLIKLEAWLPLIICMIFCLFIWSIWSTCRLIRLRRKLKFVNNEFEKLKTIKQINDDDDDDEEDINSPPIICNGTSKRKLSTDSNDSNPTRSQRVPDLTLSKIKENGIDKNECKLKRKSSNQTRHLLPISTI